MPQQAGGASSAVALGESGESGSTGILISATGLRKGRIGITTTEAAAPRLALDADRWLYAQELGARVARMSLGAGSWDRLWDQPGERCQPSADRCRASRRTQIGGTPAG